MRSGVEVYALGRPVADRTAQRKCTLRPSSRPPRLLQELAGAEGAPRPNEIPMVMVNRAKGESRRWRALRRCRPPTRRRREGGRIDLGTARGDDFIDSTTTSGGRSTFESAAESLSPLGGCCTGPVTSTFLFTFAAQSDDVDPPSTYIGADPPSTLLSTYAVPPSVVFACTTQPVSVDFGACSLAGCEGACSCASTLTAPASAAGR